MPGDTYLEQATQGDASLYGDVLPALRNADLRIVNLECALSDKGEPVAKDGGNRICDPRAVDALKLVPFDVACLANNHSMDASPEVLDDARRRLNAVDIRTVGAGSTRDEALAPLIVDTGES